MKTIKSIILVFILLVAGSTVSYAQTENHTHKAPHGGLVQEANGYHIEMVKGKDSISFYLLDAKQKTLSNKTVTGTAVFDFFNKTKSTSTLANTKKNAMWVSTPKANVFTYCTVSVVVQGKTITAKFKNDAVSQSDIDHGHQH
ncbi:MAG: hypothetical protein B7Y37_03175 [Sphingobacteriia bacterium 28-36-52]|nr:MAG: hypothetical protein B7Y37_03175 [Sphingobacteriia bacterium 28-36-52]